MKETTVCYIEKNSKYLMLHRIKKKDDINKNKWIGIGGKIEKNETPLECIIREAKEETGLTIFSPVLRGIVYFNSNIYPSEKMYLFTCTEFTGSLKVCDEGVLKWIEKEKISSLPLWEGDKIFLEALSKGETNFKLSLNYDNDTLVSYKMEQPPQQM